MTSPPKLNKIVSMLIAAVWLANGLVKVFDMVPRHGMIVARILGSGYAHTLTKAIGIAELAMAIWIVSGIKARFNALVQMTIIAVMNILEFVLAPDLLLWGKFNLLFACLFILLIYYNAMPRKKLALRS